jgi:hypothetical protein
VLAVLLGPASAAADSEPVPVDQTPSGEAADSHRIDRTWLYADDARVAAPMTVIGVSSVAYTDVGSSATRIASPYPSAYSQFAGNVAQPGAMLTVGGEVGLVPRFSILALGQMQAGGFGSGLNAGAIAGLRLNVTPASWNKVHLVASAGYLREAWAGPVYDDDNHTWAPARPNGDNGAWVQAAFSADVHRLRVATTFHGEHVFSTGRDPLDVMVDVGISYRIVGGFRLGAEWVGQDLEEAIHAGAEGGARQFVGPTASLQLLRERLTLVAGPAIGLTGNAPDVLGKAALSYGF